MRALSTISVAVLLAVAAGFQSVPEASASNTIAKQQGLSCTSCHDKAGSKLLTDRGKYYELMSSLEGYEELEATFSKCTTCHVRKPGSLELTKKGKQFQWMMNDMEGLKELLLGHHPSQELEESSPADPPSGVSRRE